MSEAKDKSPFSPSALSNSLDAIFAQNVDLCFTAQTQVIATVDALTHGWLHRRQEGVDAIYKAIEEMVESHDHPAEILRIQQDWLAGVSRRATEDIAALNDGISSLAKTATADIETVAATTLTDNIVSMTKQATTDFESAAYTAASPIRAVGEEKLKATGKPRRASDR